MPKRKPENKNEKPNEENKTGVDNELDNLSKASKGKSAGRPKSDTPKKGYLIKIDPEFKDLLTDHFFEQGLNFSAGVRQILHKYANDRRLKK